MSNSDRALLSEDMQKPLFYLTPFITCSKCNSILFIDAANARCFGAPVPESVRLKRGGNETLAVCPGCAMTENLEVGAHDFMEDIEDASISASRRVETFSLHRRASSISRGGRETDFRAMRRRGKNGQMR